MTRMGPVREIIMIETEGTIAFDELDDRMLRRVVVAHEPSAHLRPGVSLCDCLCGVMCFFRLICGSHRGLPVAVPFLTTSTSLSGFVEHCVYVCASVLD